MKAITVYTRTLANRSIILASVFSLALGASRATAGPIPISESLPAGMTAQEFNEMTASMVLQDDLAALVDLAISAPVQAQTIGTVTGTVSDSSWNLRLSGQLNGVPLTITQNGALDPTTSVASWTDTGSYGTAPFLSSGTIADDAWTLSDVCFVSSYVLDLATTTISFLTGGGGGAAASTVNALGHVLINDAQYRPLHPTKKNPNSWGCYSSLSGTLPNNGNTPIRINQVGVLNQSTSQFQSTVSAPENPSSLGLLGLATISLLAYGWRRQMAEA